MHASKKAGYSWKVRWWPWTAMRPAHPDWNQSLDHQIIGPFLKASGGLPINNLIFGLRSLDDSKSPRSGPCQRAQPHRIVEFHDPPRTTDQTAFPQLAQHA
jgi:hypothetical protein